MPPSRFVCPQCRSTAVRTVQMTPTTLRLMCDECDYEWEIARGAEDQGKR